VATAQLRPLSIGEILDSALKVVMRHWKPLMLAVVVPILPLQILSVLLTASMDLETALDEFERSGDPADIPTSFWVSGGLGTIVTFLMTFIVQAVCFKAVADAWLGAEPSAGRSWRFAFRRTFALVVMITTMLAVFVLGLLLCGIPSVWLSVMWSVATAALLFERLGPFKALGRSFELLKKRFWATLLLMIVTTLLTTFVSALIAGIPSALTTLFAPDNEIATGVSDVIFGTLGSAFVLPISAAAFTILYFDQRVRKEGFDVQLLAQGIGAEYDPNAPIPAPLAPAGGWPPPPQPGWQPPPQQYGGGWSAPSPDAPLRWGPAAEERPPENGSGGWAPPRADDRPDQRERDEP
jgi:hypothetical protein